MALRKRKYVPRERLLTAVRFDGKNSKEIADWVNKEGINDPQPVTARARGFQVVLTHEDGKTMTLKKGQWLSRDEVFWAIWEDDQFKTWLVAKKPAISDKRARATLEADLAAAKE